MIVAIDIETQGLDCNKFILAVMIKENGVTKTYYKKEQLWQDILTLAKKEQKRKKTLNIYSHNAIYDFYGYAPITDKNLKWFCTKPFIVKYEQNQKEIISFLDTLSIYRMSLKKLGQLINIPKQEIPKKLLQKQITGKYTKKELKQIEQYCKQDTLIVLESIKKMKQILKKENIKIKRLYTINQIAINYLINQWRKIPNNDFIFWNAQKGEMRRVYRKQEIHAAYRGGRVQAFKKGTYKNVTYIDCNSLYPFAATKIEFPDLRTERKTWKPLKNGQTIKQIINQIGISKAMVTNNTNTLGLLPIRTPQKTYYPKKGTTLIGTWTHIELKEAIKEGYTINDIEWTIHYKQAPNNPFIETMNNLYQMRQQGQFEKYFYKGMMNCCLGKLAQTRTEQEIRIDSIEKVKEYLQNNWKQIKGIGYNYMYKRTLNNKTKKYYAPIIPTLINAYARIYMYKQYKKIPQKDLLYTDTDSILYKNEHIKQFKVGKEMGQFKIEHQHEILQTYGRKTYKIGKEIKISGMHTKNITEKQFQKGNVQDKKMQTIKTTTNIKEAGTFKTEKRNLNKQQQNEEEAEKLIEQEVILIDSDITDISYFIPQINETFK